MVPLDRWAWRESANRRIASFREPESAGNRPGALPGASRGTPAEETFPGSGYDDPPQEGVSAKSISVRMHLRCVRNQPPQHRPTMLACSARPQSGLVKSRRKGPLRCSARSQRTRLGASVNQAALVPTLGGSDILRNWLRRSQREWSSEQPILGRMHWSPADEVVSIAVRTYHVGVSTLVTQGQWNRWGIIRGEFRNDNNNCNLPSGGSSSSPCDIWACGPGAVVSLRGISERQQQL